MFSFYQGEPPDLSQQSPTVPNQGKSSNTLNLLELICYRCQNRGYYAKDFPTKKLANLTSLELKGKNVKGCGELVKSDLEMSNASITHLLLPKEVEIGL